MHMRLGYQLLLSYMILAIIPICSIGFYAYTSSIEALQNETVLRLQGTLQQVRNNVEYRQNEMERTVDQIFYDQRFQAAIFDYSNGWDGYLAVTQDILPRLSGALSLTSYDVHLTTYIRNTSFPEVRTANPGDPVGSGKRADLCQIFRFPDQQWLASQSDQSLEHGLWIQTASDVKYGNITYLRDLLYFQNGNPLGVIQISAKMQDLFAAINDVKPAEGYTIMVVDTHNRLRFGEGVQGKVSDTQDDSSGYLTVSETLPGLNWRLIASVPLIKFHRDTDNIRNATILLCTVVFLCLALCGWLISRLISRRIDRIIQALRAIQTGDFGKRIPDRQTDELSQIENAFNEMATKLGALVQEVYINKIKKKEAELNTLQAQINPHFLYNTLSGMSHLAKLGELDKLQEMILGMATFYRLSLNKGRNLVTVNEELQQLRAYLSIEKIKHGDDIEVFYDIDPEILPCVTLKLLLQPFAENVLMHARYIRPVHMRIVARREETNILFQVIDDGIGMTEETLAKLGRVSEEGEGGYGIHNVDQRIKLQFGDEYGVSIFSQSGIGTTVTLTIPVTTWSTLTQQGVSTQTLIGQV